MRFSIQPSKTSRSLCIRATVCLCVVSLIAGCILNPTPQANLASNVGNPALITTYNVDQSWERIVETINDFHFQIENEDRLAGTIETKYKAGASILEPWHADAVGLENRLEGTFQSIRRRLLISVQPSPPNGLQVEVKAFKELEDLPGLAANSPGGATFRESTPLERDMKVVVGQSTPSTWIPQGRDKALEQQVMARILAVAGR